MTMLLALAAVVGMFEAGEPGTNKDIDVEVIEVTSTPKSIAHGRYAIDKLAQGAGGDRVRVIYANPFREDPKNPGATNVSIDWHVIVRGMIAMKKAGAKYVCTSFTTTDAERSRDLKSVADQLGMILVASLGNGELDRPYPAMVPGVIAVLGVEQSTSVSREVRDRADYKLSGTVRPGVRGSSFAAARVCGQLATGR